MAAAAGHAVKEGDYYKVLGLTFTASEEDIKKQYHSIVRTLHPDRRRPGTGGGEALEKFHQVQSAWRCLSDPTRRLLYDLRNFGRSSIGGEATEVDDVAEMQLVAMQFEQAKRDVENMEVQLQKVLRRERAARGVIVRKALYGDLRLHKDSLDECLSGSRTIEAEDLVGPVLEVSGPLQCLVEQHTIVLPGGASASKADLPGFYNPTPLNAEVDLSLYVLYEFKGALHEVLVGDRETLSLPYRRHVVPAGKSPRGPFSPSNVSLLCAAGGRAAAPSRRSGSPRRAAAAGAAAGAEVPVETKRKSSGVSAEGKAALALARAVQAYRLRRLQPPVTDPTEPSPREFVIVSAVASMSLFAAMWWATGGRD